MDSIITEGTKETPTGRVHKAEPGGYGRKDDEDDEGKKVQPTVKRGRGRPKKDADSSTGQVAKYDNAKNLQSFMVGNLPGGKAPGKKGQVHKIKDESVMEGDIEDAEKAHQKINTPAALRKAKGGDWKVSSKDLEKEKARTGTSPEGLAALKDKTGLEEATKETSTGKIHKAEPGGYGRKDDEDDEGKKVQAQVKRGRGRPKKGADSDTGEVKKWDTDKLSSWIIGNKPKSLPGKASVKHKLKDWMEYVEKKTILESVAVEGRMKDIMWADAEKLSKEDFLDKYPEFEDFWMSINVDPEDEQELDEMSLDPSQVAVPQIKAAGATMAQQSQQPQQQQQAQQPGKPLQQTSAGQTNQPQMGAAIIDFKQANDPLQKAMQQAIKNKQVTVMATESREFNTESMAQKLDRLLQNYPYERKLADEGWGIHESLYQALCDHYWDNGFIPREVMYGPSDKLREFVESCYSKDMLGEQGIEEVAPELGHEVDEGLAGAAIGRVAGAAIAPQIAPVSGAIGGALGSKLQDTMFANEADENFLEQDLHHTALEMEMKNAMNESKLNEKAKSKAQQKFMGMVHAAQKGEKPASKEVADVAKGMKKKDAKDFASTKHKGLPEKVKKKTDESVEQEVTEEQEVEESGLQAYLGNKKYGKEGMDALRKAGREGAGKEKMAKLRAKFDKKDAQMESWENQLSTLLTEGMTITTSTGNEGASDSVSISATDADAQTLMKMLQNSGLMRGQSSSMSTEPQGDDHASVTVEPVSADEVMGTLQPADDNGDDAMGFLKRMLGARGEHSHVDSSDHEHGDYEKEVDEMHNQTASSGDAQMSPVPEEEEMEEGNLFTGNLAKARAAGKKEADLDGDGDMEKVKEDEVEEGNKFTGNLAKARAAGKKEADLDGDGDMEKVKEDEWQGTAETDMATAVSQEANDKEDAETEKETAMSEGEDTCNECGMYESKCGCDHGQEEKLDEWANSPNDSDEKFLTDLTYMTKTLSGGLNNMKRDQTVLPSARVKTEVESRSGELSLAELIRKLQNIN